MSSGSTLHFVIPRGLWVGSSRWEQQDGRETNAPISGALEIFSHPASGRSISRISTSDVQTDSAHTSSTAMTVAFRGAKRPKLLPKIAVNQNTSATRNGSGIDEPVLCSRTLEDQLGPTTEDDRRRHVLPLHETC